MIANIFLLIVCVVYNEAYADFTDDLDYVAVSGMFVPISMNNNYEDSDELLTRQILGQEIIDEARGILNQVKSAAQLIQKIQEAIRSRKAEIPLYENCIADISLEKSNYKIEASKEKCKNGINFRKVVKVLFQTFDVDAMSSGFIQSNNIFIRSFIITPQVVSIDASYRGVFSHTQSMIRLVNVDLKLDIPRTPDTKLKFEFTGKLNNLIAKVVYNLAESSIVKITVQVGRTTVGNFIKSWGLQPDDLANTAFPFDKLKDAEISGIVKGLYDTKDNHFQLLAQLQYKDEVVDLSVNLVVDKTKGKPIAVAFVAKLASIANIVDYLKGKFNYNGPDFIKQLIKSGTLSISNKKINLIEYNGFLKLDGKAQKSVEYGVHIYIETDMKQALENCAEGKPVTATNTETRTSNKNSKLIKISIKKTGVVVVLPKNFTQDLKILMKCFLKEMNIYVQTVVVPDILEKSKKENSFYISELSFLNKEFKITVAYNGDIDVPFLGLKISNPTFAISKVKGSKNKENNVNLIEAKKEKENPWIFKGQAEVISEALVDTTNKGSIDFTFDTNQKFDVNIKIPALEFKSLAKYFGVKPFEGNNKNLEERFSFGVNDLYINGKLNLKEKSGELTVTASPVINGMTGLKLAVLIWKIKNQQNSGSIGVAFGLVMKNLRLDHALKKFAGVEMPESWLSDVSIVMLASTADKNYCKESGNEELPECEKSSKKLAYQSKRSDDEEPEDGNNTEEEEEAEAEEEAEDTDEVELKNTHFETIDELRELDIVRGIILKASVKLDKKEKCMGNGICEFLVTKGFKEISLKGTITPTSLQIEAKLNGEIQLGDKPGVTLKEIKLEMKFGSSENKISISCEFHTVSPELKITGYIELDLSGKLQIGGTMEGMIKKPFGVQWLAFGNLNLFIGLDLKTALPSLEMGAEIWLGNLEGDKQELFKFQGYFGFDAGNPLNSFFYARSFGADLTLENILRALGSQRTLPEMVAKSGFIGELIIAVSFYTDDKPIRGLDFSIPPGFMFKGKISVLGYNIECDLKFNPKKGSFFLNAMFDPITDWGAGVIQLYRSAEEQELGPVLYIDVSSEKFEVCIRGYISILGIQASVDIQITNTQFSFKVTGNLFNILTMDISIEASYANSKLESFKFNGCVGLGVITKVTESAKKAIEEARKKAQATFDAAQATLQDAEKNVAAARAKIDEWKKGLNDYRDKLKAREIQLEKERAAMQGNCAEECGTVCIPFFGWNSNCYTVWGLPVGCLTWDYCKWQAPNLICIAGCEIKKGWAKFASWAEQLGLKIMAGLSKIGDFFLDAASGVTKLADGIINIAKNLVEFARKVTDEILKAAANLLTIEIRSICLSAEFDPNAKTCAGVSLDGKYMNIEFGFKGSMCFDSSAFSSLGSTATKTAEPKIEKLDETAASVDAKAKDVKRACNDMDKETKRVEDDVKSTTTSKIEKRSHVPTAEEIRLHKLIHDPLPEVNLRSDETNSAMKKAVPWEYLNAEDANVVQYRNNVSVRHKIPNEESHDFCHQHQNVLSRYSTIADSFSSAISNANRAKEGYMNKKRSYLHEIDYLNGLVRSGPLNNITLDEQQDLVHWRDYAEEHVKSFIEKATAAFHSRKRDSINHVRQALSDAIESDRGLKLPEYIKHLHSLAVTADKKSQIDKKPYKDNSISLHHIKEILLNVASDDRMPSIELAKGIGKVQKMLSDMKRSSIPCAA